MDESIVVRALGARARLKLSRRVEDEGRSLVMMKHGRPQALLLSMGSWVRYLARGRVFLIANPRNAIVSLLNIVGHTHCVDLVFPA